MGWIKDDEISESEKIKYNGGLVSHTISSFKNKSLMTPSDLEKGKLILDAGCGNGRYAHQASKYGGEVIGIDIGTRTVESAYENCRKFRNITIIQADIFNLPFKPETFDTIFSIGVLHHTGNAKEAFNSLVRVLKPNGVITVHLYHKLNPIWEFNDYLLRTFTTRMSIENNLKFAEFMSKLARTIYRINPKLLSFLNLFFRIQPTLHHMYDWYSAPIATHHTYDEVEKWFIRNGLKIIQTNRPKNRNIISKPWSLTIKGIKQ